MKAITLAQPWASLVAVGEKSLHAVDFDTNYRGPIAIVAAPDKTDSDRQTASNRPFATLLQAHGLDYETLPYGQVIAIANLTDVLNYPNTIAARPGFVTRQERKLSNAHFTHSNLLVFSDVAALDIPYAAESRSKKLWELDGEPVITPAEGNITFIPADPTEPETLLVAELKEYMANTEQYTYSPDGDVTEVIPPKKSRK